MASPHARTDHAHEAENHWWWRPGWRFGRKGYTTYITFGDDNGGDALLPHAQRQQEALQPLQQVDLVPLEWLHLTVQGIGFTDEISSGQLDELIEAARTRLSSVPAFALTFGRPVLRPEAVALHPSVPDPAVQLRRVLRSAVADALGVDHVDGRIEDWQPHVSLAYVNTPGPAEAIVRAIEAAPDEQTTITVQAVSLIAMERDEQVYRWTDVADLGLQAP